jgi:hypothetical protein
MKNKTCPIGLICFDTKYIILLFIIIILSLVYYIHCKENKPEPIKYTPVPPPAPPKKLMSQQKPIIINKPPPVVSKYVIKNQDTYLVNKDYERVTNPLLPPERRNHYIDPHSHAMVTPGVPINIPTRGYSGGVQQVGALYKQDSSDETIKIGNNNEPVILPLFGMPTYNGSNKWMYYTATDKFNQIKIPITNKNRECSVEYGCDELYDGDIVTIPAYNGNFKVSKYQYDKPRYIPHIL